MVEKITIFEPHFDGAQFGPSGTGADVEETEIRKEMLEAAEEHDESDGSSRSRLLVGAGLLALVVGGVVAYRRRSEEPTDDVETDAEPSEEIAIE